MEPSKLNEKYKPLYTSKDRYFFLTGGRGSGKSHSVHEFILRLTYQEGERILFTRYTMNSAEESIIPEFRDAIERLGVSDHFHTTAKKVINLTNGSEIYFSGIKTSSGDQTGKLKSLPDVTCWVLEEGEDLTDEKTFDKIDLSIRVQGRQNRVIVIMNPTTREHFLYKKWVQPKSKKINIDGHDITVGDVDGVTYIHTTYLDNIDNLEESFLNRLYEMKRDNPKKYIQVVLGGWKEKADGCIFDYKERPFDDSLPYGFGLDFGHSHPTALGRIAMDGQRIYLKQELYAPGSEIGTQGIIDKLSEVASNDELIVADRAEMGLINEIWDAGFNIQPCTKGQGSVVRGIRQMNDYELCIDPDSTDWKREGNLYRWADRKGEVPNKEHDHLWDGARYYVDYVLSTPEVYTA